MSQSKPLPFPGLPADPVDEENDAREQIRAAGWWDRASFPESWPLSSTLAAILLREAGEYAVSAESAEDLARRRLIGFPGVSESEEFEWNAVDVIQLANTLEVRREWIPGSRHDAKKHPMQKHLDTLREAGPLAPPEGIPHLDLRQIALMLTTADNREAREIHFVALQAILETDHGIRI
ncbi:hypothetical protein [Zavarzinella formosa]|uniref:hypothetical protein n=1 Tax=Zavarzinella formosa TaxID=360055 RepID=UPI0002F3D73E|nr:hypothetical protein [Zavarzinella formosa]